MSDFQSYWGMANEQPVTLWRQPSISAFRNNVLSLFELQRRCTTHGASPATVRVASQVA
jgi:hypothetical protein